MSESRSTYKWIPVADTATLPIKEGRRVVCEDFELALFNLGDGYLAVDNRCPHKSGPLADGIVAGHAVFCPLHNWKIDLQTGCALTGGKGNVKVYPVKVVGEKVCIALEEGKISEQSSACD